MGLSGTLKGVSLCGQVRRGTVLQVGESKWRVPGRLPDLAASMSRSELDQSV